jgi:hypothetical protein
MMTPEGSAQSPGCGEGVQCKCSVVPSEEKTRKRKQQGVKLLDPEDAGLRMAFRWPDSAKKNAFAITLDALDREHPTCDKVVWEVCEKQLELWLSCACQGQSLQREH